MQSPRAWVLNLDAELEFSDPSYRPSKRMQRRIDALIPSLGLDPEGGLLVLPRDDTEPLPPKLQAALEQIRQDPEPQAGTWCPTPSALAILERHGLRCPESPDFDIIRRVNHRRFALGILSDTIANAATNTVIGLAVEAYIDHREQLEAHLAQQPRIDRWILKRPYGYSGRARRIINRRLLAADLRWIDASWTEYGGGFLLEPYVEIIQDFVLHGEIRHDGIGGKELNDDSQSRFGHPVIQHCDRDGAWLHNSLAGPGDLSQAELQTLSATGHVIADALIKAGYWGPFGIDAYRWRDSNGREHFRPLSEINARYTMGWWRALGARGRCFRTRRE